LVRAQTSDDIRPRALCTPPPKSFARSPRTLHPANAATGITVWSASFAPEYTWRPIVTFTPHIANDSTIEAPPRSLPSVRTRFCRLVRTAAVLAVEIQFRPGHGTFAEPGRVSGSSNQTRPRPHMTTRLDS
jgi:hypothetical protein